MTSRSHIVPLNTQIYVAPTEVLELESNETEYFQTNEVTNLPKCSLDTSAISERLIIIDKRNVRNRISSGKYHYYQTQLSMMSIRIRLRNTYNYISDVHTGAVQTFPLE